MAETDKIKDLERELKTAFKEELFEDVRKLASEIKKTDPENHLADRIMEKTEDAEAKKLRKANIEKINDLEKQIKEAFKNGLLAEVNKLAEEIKKLDPKNKTVNKIETRIEKAKASIEADAKKEKIKALKAEIKEFMKGNQWDKAAESANKLLEVEWENSFAIKALKKAAKEKNVEHTTLITASPPKEKPEAEVRPEAEAKPKIETKPEVKAPTEEKEEVKPVVKEAAEEKKPAKPVKVEEKVESAVSRPASPGQPAPVWTGRGDRPREQARDKEKLKHLEESLKSALKEENDTGIRTAMEEIKKLDPENRAVKKAQAKLDKEKEKKEKEVKKEKFRAFKAEAREFIKNEQWDEVIKGAKKFLETDPENSFAAKILKKAEKEKGTGDIAQIEKVTPKKGEEKPGFFARLFGKKAEAPAEKVEKIPEKKEKPIEEKPKLEVKKEADVLRKAVPPAAVKPAVIPEKAPAVTPAQLFAPKPEVIRPGAPAPAAVPPAGAPVTPISKAPAVPPVAPKPAVRPGTFAPVKPAVAPPPSQPAVVKPMAVVPPGKTEEPAKAKAEPEKAGAKPPEKAEEKGNIFTRLFGKKEAEKPPESIIETIVAQTGKPKPEAAKKVVKKVKKEEGLGEGYIRFASLFLKFSVVFIAISAIFFYVFNIDEENRVMGAMDKENYAVRLKNVADDLEKKKDEEKKLNKDIDYYQKGYKNEFEEIINNIVGNRMNWTSLIRKLNEVTESVYEKNALAKYVTYNNYSYDVETGQLRVNGTLSDPLGKNLTKLAELEEAFKYYPKDKNDPTDETKPYFYNLQEFRSYAKTLDQTTGRFKSNFTLSLFTKIPAEKK